jgi:CelD/BcsL family acetyltransferase involved in cellulose biosynthesis
MTEATKENGGLLRSRLVLQILRTGVLDTREQENSGHQSQSRAFRVIKMLSWEGAGVLQRAWNGLVDRSPECSVFQTFQWHSAWWKAFGGAHEPFVLFAYAGARLVGIAPMMITRARGIGARRLHFIGSINHASDYCDFIIDRDSPEALHALLEGMCADTMAFSRIDLSHLPGHSPNLARTLEYLRGRGVKVWTKTEAAAPVRILGDVPADLKAANKTSLRRHTASLQRSGDLRFHRCASEAEILAYLEEFFEQHKARWAQAATRSQFFDPTQQAFYRELVRTLSPCGWLRFDAVLFNGKPLAFHFGFEFRRRFIWYKPTFDVGFARRSPGEVLIKFLLEDAISRKLEEFDFTVGAERFKYRFANRTRFIARLIAFRYARDYWIYRAARRSKSLLTAPARSQVPATPVA